MTFLVSRIFFYTGVMYANFRIEGKVNELIDLITQSKTKGEKKSAFCFKIFVGTSDEWDAELVSELLISFSTSGRHSFERKANIAFFENHFDTRLILVFRYCG